jgi:hypothetical protein
LGENHPNTLISINNLAVVYDKQSQHKMAHSLHEECLDKKKSMLGDTHIYVLSSMSNLAVLYNAET